jgi:hypothetical protein
MRAKATGRDKRDVDLPRGVIAVGRRFIPSSRAKFVDLRFVISATFFRHLGTLGPFVNAYDIVKALRQRMRRATR